MALIPDDPFKPNKTDIFRAQCFKTDLCQYHPNCIRSADCPFAHGHEELRGRPKLRKTAICKAWKKARCNLIAAECEFAHGPWDLRMTPDFRKAAHRAQGRAAVPSKKGTPESGSRKCQQPSEEPWALPESPATQPQTGMLHQRPGAGSTGDLTRNPVHPGPQRLGLELQTLEPAPRFPLPEPETDLMLPGPFPVDLAPALGVPESCPAEPPPAPAVHKMYSSSAAQRAQVHRLAEVAAPTGAAAPPSAVPAGATHRGSGGSPGDVPPTQAMFGGAGTGTDAAELGSASLGGSRPLFGATPWMQEGCSVGQQHGLYYVLCVCPVEVNVWGVEPQPY